METWNRVLDATEQALSAAEATNVLAGPELLWRRQRLTEERRWLVRLRSSGRMTRSSTSLILNLLLTGTDARSTGKKSEIFPANGTVSTH
jgi:hypothetical protein